MLNAASIPELVLSAARDPAIRKRQALWTEECSLEYSELEDAIARSAGLLLAAGLKRGDRVGLLAGRTDSGFPNAGIGVELDAIAAVIIGGASFFGGRGTVLGVLAGVLIMGILRNGLNINNVSAFWQQILIGMVIIIAVYIDVLRRQAATRH